MLAVTNMIKLLRCICACVHLGLTLFPLVFLFLYLCMSAHTHACGSTYHSICPGLNVFVFVCPYDYVDLCE